MTAIQKKKYDRIYIDIDTQNDFLRPDGRLYVPGAEAIHVNLVRLIDFARGNGIPIVSSADDHPPDDPEFEQYPPHCLHGTPGQQKMPGTVVPDHLVIPPDAEPISDFVALLERHPQLIFSKTTFNVFDNPRFAGLVEMVQAEQYVVFGVATDVCVAKAVDGLLDRHRNVTLVTDAVQAIDDDEGRRCCESFAERGARLCESKDIVGDAS